VVNTLCTATGPGNAQLAQYWAQAYGLYNVMVWGDTTDYMYLNFMQHPPANVAYPGIFVVDLDTMELTDFKVGDIHQVDASVNAILQADHPCAEY
jgi:hypothetical protein